MLSLDPIRTDNAAANPLLLAGAPDSVDGRVQFYICLLKVFLCLFDVLVDLLHHGCLLDNDSVEIDNQGGQLVHLLLDLEQLLVSVLHLVQDSAGLALAVALHHGLLEDLATATSRHVINSSAHLALWCVWAHDEVLSFHLLLHLVTVGSLELLVLLNSVLQLAIETVNLAPVALGLGVALEFPQSLDEAPVAGHGFGRELVELARGAGACVGLVECAILEHPELFEVLVDGVDTVSDISYLVQRIGGRAGGSPSLGERGHLDIVT